MLKCTNIFKSMIDSLAHFLFLNVRTIFEWYGSCLDLDSQRSKKLYIAFQCSCFIIPSLLLRNCCWGGFDRYGPHMCGHWLACCRSEGTNLGIPGMSKSLGKQIITHHPSTQGILSPKGLFFYVFFLREFPWLVSAILGVMFFWFAKILMFNSQGISFRSWRKKHINIFIIVGRFPEASLVGHGWFMLISADQRKTWVL